MLFRSPTQPMPRLVAARTTARTAAFMPGASPPLVRTPIRLICFSIKTSHLFGRTVYAGMALNEVGSLLWQQESGSAPGKFPLYPNIPPEGIPVKIFCRKTKFPLEID